MSKHDDFDLALARGRTAVITNLTFTAVAVLALVAAFQAISGMANGEYIYPVSTFLTALAGGLLLPLDFLVMPFRPQVSLETVTRVTVGLGVLLLSTAVKA